MWPFSRRYGDRYEMDLEKYERARLEMIDSELSDSQSNLQNASTALADENVPKSRELLKQAQHSLELALFHIEKLPMTDPSRLDRAELLRQNVEELSRQIDKNAS